MNKLSICMLLGILASTQASCAPNSLNGADYIKQQGWVVVNKKLPAVPVKGISVLMFHIKDNNALGCGLLTQTAGAPAFIEINVPEEEELFPECYSINELQPFALNKRKYLVVDYVSHVTKGAFSRQFFYVYQDAKGNWVGDQDLNISDAVLGPKPDKGKSVDEPRAIDGVKQARAYYLGKSVPNMKMSSRDFLVDGNRAFAIFQDKEKSKCTLVMDTEGAPASFSHALFSDADKCRDILASSRLEHKGITYYLAMFKGVSQNRLAVVSVNQANVVTAEKELSATINKSGKLTDMKMAKQAVSSAL